MPIALVARARSMDGSADLKWRRLKTSGPQARSIDSFFNDVSLQTSSSSSSSSTSPQALIASSILNANIKYNHATSKSSVSIPQYHFDGGPEVTSTILGLCWRLTDLRCPPITNEPRPEPVVPGLRSKVHPCCKLNRKAGHDSTGDSRISKWLTSHNSHNINSSNSNNSGATSNGL